KNHIMLMENFNIWVLGLLANEEDYN
ncbi:MAG: hypothetical protein PWQ67_2450, partial [Clostridia bacterium]|nr:hypothetical protein [Clostridia bacterium]MDN5323996.1 hypothetical protein [Clostridia bacterium]